MTLNIVGITVWDAALAYLARNQQAGKKEAERPEPDSGPGATSSAALKGLSGRSPKARDGRLLADYCLTRFT